MKEEELYRIIFTLFQIFWAFIWAANHIKIRRLRRYAGNRAQASTNRRYKVVSFFLYISQNILCIASFWSNSQLLLKIHDSNSMRFVGLILISLATILYLKSLSYLGRNYSPCFDSHIPYELISSGPYKFTRHPMYLAKLMVLIGNFVISRLSMVFTYVHILRAGNNKNDCQRREIFGNVHSGIYGLQKKNNQDDSISILS